jgi:uncharacterized protein (DUF1697 family)
MGATKRYAAFLRGVSPMNAKMSELKKCLEKAGFEDVKTVLASGNVVFGARPKPLRSLERAVEKAMEDGLDRTFLTIVRPIDQLRQLIERDPFKAFRLKPGSKRVVTFFRGKPEARLDLPIELDGARILHMEHGEVFTAYVVSAKGPVFMSLIQKTFGEEITTRTWETVQKVAR